MVFEHTVMVPLEQCCKQVIRHERRCSLKANHGEYCQQHKGRTLYDLVSYDTGISKKQIDNVVTALVKRMGWEQVKAFQHEMARGQLYEDAGGYFTRAIGKLFGARGRYDELDICKRAAKEATKGEPS